MERDGGDALYRVLGLLERVHKAGNGYDASCPSAAHAHGDRHPSLSVTRGDDGRLLLHCHAGCETSDILAALRLEWSDLFDHSRQGNTVRRFRVHANGQVYDHVREDAPDGKRIWWETNGHKGLDGVALADVPLYGAQHLSERPDEPVYVCEGEKAAQALVDIGLLAVGTMCGAGTIPSDAVLSVLYGRLVRLWPDNDAKGSAHMEGIAARLRGQSEWVRWPQANDGDDAANYIASGGTADGVAALVARAARRTGPRLAVVRAAHVRPEAIDWLWRGRLARGKPTLIMGDPGLGKSLLTHTCSAVVSVGGSWPDGEICERGSAILFTIEDGLADTVVPRLMAAHADMQRVLCVRGVVDSDTSLDERMFALTEHLALLEELIESEHAVFVAMDPVTAYLGPDVNSHKESEVRMVLGPLQMMCERTRVALAMLMHLNKGTGVSALYRAVGSIAFPAVARVVLGVAPDPNDEDNRRRLLLPLKMNIGEMPDGIGYRIERSRGILPRATENDQPPILIWDNEAVLVDAANAMDRSATPAESAATAAAKQTIVQLFATAGTQRLMANDCQRALRDNGCSTSGSVIDRVKKDLGIRSERDNPTGPWWWVLPPTIPSRARMEPGIVGLWDSGQARDSGPTIPPTIPPAQSQESHNPHNPPRAREGTDEVYTRWQQSTQLELAPAEGRHCRWCQRPPHPPDERCRLYEDMPDEDA